MFKEDPAIVSRLNDGEFQALLDEAILHYTCPKEGKSNLFKELLQEVDVDETEEVRRAVTSACYLPGSNRRRHKRDSVSERLTHGGSLQNLAQSFDCGGRRKGKKHTGPSVSARQREGGSLPSNVNASHNLTSLINFDIVFDKKGFSEERSIFDWSSKEKSKPLDKPTHERNSKKEEKDKEKKESKKEVSAISNEIENDARDKRNSNRVNPVTNEMLESNNPPSDYDQDYMVIDVEDVEYFAQKGGLNNRQASAAVGSATRKCLDTGEDEGTEMKVIEPRKPVQFVTRATFDIAQTPVDSPVEFPLHRVEHITKLDKTKLPVNGTDGTGSLPLQQYSNNVKCIVGGPSSSAYSVLPWSSPNMGMDTMSRFSQHRMEKDASLSADKKSLDENGNAVQGFNGERKKPRRKHAQEPNVIVYNAENVEGHRDEDIDSLINFIENKESKGKKGKPSNNTVRVKAASGAKTRTAREKDMKREPIPAKLQKSNSLEEISKTKLEDLTTEKNTCSSEASSVSSQPGVVNVALRRAKQRSTGDSTVDSRGDRRSWGTAEGQSIYCNDTGDDYTAAAKRAAGKKAAVEPETETEFHVVRKKKKSKKQHRSSSGGRAQNLTSSGSYLQRSRAFNDYRAPLSPELRRKSASSMPPSDKSDSSDLDSVHSLPVTSNSTEHNVVEVATSTGSTSQVSYADITRMAAANMSTSAVLNMSGIAPSLLSTSTWPSVSAKSPSELDKVPNDYPSLEEIQHSDRKQRQHNATQSNNQPAPLNVGVEKPLLPTAKSKENVAVDTKKSEAQQEETMKKVFQYVQDIEKIQQQESKQQSSNNSSPNSSIVASANPLPPKLNNSVPNCSPPDTEDNNSCESGSSKDVNVGKSLRPRKNHQPNPTNREPIPPIQSQVEDSKKTTVQPGECTNTSSNVRPQQSEKDAKKPGTVPSTNVTPVENLDVGKTKAANITKPTQSQQNVKTLDAEASRMSQTERLTKALKDQQQTPTLKSDVVKNPPAAALQATQEDPAKLRHQNSIEKERKPAEVQIATKKCMGRPAVILLDDNSADTARNSESSSELTFGFEINEQLLQSEEGEPSPMPGPELIQKIAHSFEKSLPQFNRPPPMNEKHNRNEKFPPNMQMNQQYIHPHIPVHAPMMMSPHILIGFHPRMPPIATTLIPVIPPRMPMVEKCRTPPREELTVRYVAPEECHVVHNHDKIVNFVETAWKDVIREIPEPTLVYTGRVQYYSGQ